MKTIVCRLGLGLGLLAGLLSPATVWAQDSSSSGPTTVAPTPSRAPQEANWKEASEQVDDVWRQADSARQAREYAGAADLYISIYNRLPPSTQAQKAALQAAQCFDALERPTQAVEMYDRVVQMGA